jgi:hypothetical protein
VNLATWRPIYKVTFSPPRRSTSRTAFLQRPGRHEGDDDLVVLTVQVTRRSAPGVAQICTPTSSGPAARPHRRREAVAVARHSCSYQPPPMPIWVRPPEMMSTVAATLPDTPDCVPHGGTHRPKLTLRWCREGRHHDQSLVGASSLGTDGVEMVVHPDRVPSAVNRVWPGPPSLTSDFRWECRRGHSPTLLDEQSEAHSLRL